MNKIPKKIHYCWFGNNKKSKLIEKCISSWKKYCPDYEIIEWNESNFDVSAHPYTKKAYKEKKWAFVSDYARVKIIYENGGIYLDTDMEVVKSLDDFLKNESFFGLESKDIINGAIMGAIKQHDFLKKILKRYKKEDNFVLIPSIITKEYKKFEQKERVKVFHQSYFYPLPFNQKFKREFITKNTHTIHWWEFSWGTKLKKIFYRIGILRILSRIKTFFNRR